jgi:hypothetical protein
MLHSDETANTPLVMEDSNGGSCKAPLAASERRQKVTPIRDPKRITKLGLLGHSVIPIPTSPHPIKAPIHASIHPWSGIVAENSLTDSGERLQ